MAARYVVEHLNHLGIVAEVCREIGIAAWLDSHDPTSRQRVSVGTATVALVLNGLGWSNRQLYLVPQFFADKPVEHLLGPGIRAEELNDDCLGRTLDWLYVHNVTTLFAGLALRARRAFGVTINRLHADTTSFSVHGQYESPPSEAVSLASATEETGGTGDHDLPGIIEVTYGYSRDHRADLKQWMLALITSGEGVPQFLRPLDGQASDKRALLDAVLALTAQLKASGETPGVYVADSGIYSGQNMTTLNTVGVLWASRVPETMTQAQAIVREEPSAWQTNTEGTRHWWIRVVDLPQGRERWIVVRSEEGVKRARATLQRQAARDLASWTKRLWHLGNTTFACQADAEAALSKALERVPGWVQVQAAIRAVSKQAKPGRPRKDAVPATQVWQIEATVVLAPDAIEAEALRRAAYIIGTNLLDEEAWPDEAVIALYHEQTVAERGFAFLKDPLFLAASVFVKKPERIMAIAFIMVVCLLVYKVAELRIRQRLVATGQTVPDQVRKPSVRPTMRWGFSSASRGSTCTKPSGPTGYGRGRSCASRTSIARFYACSDQPTNTAIWWRGNVRTERKVKYPFRVLGHFENRSSSMRAGRLSGLVLWGLECSLLSFLLGRFARGPISCYTVLSNERLLRLLHPEVKREEGDKREHSPMKREEASQELHFVVVNDPTHDFDLTQEARIGDWLSAAIYRVGWGSAEEWRVSFSPRQQGSQVFELSWETFQKIAQTFAAFREEMRPKTKDTQDAD